MSAEIDVNGCAWCGVGERVHASRFAPVVGQHLYATPTDRQRLRRMRERDWATGQPS